MKQEQPLDPAAPLSGCDQEPLEQTGPPAISSDSENRGEDRAHAVLTRPPRCLVLRA